MQYTCSQFLFAVQMQTIKQFTRISVGGIFNACILSYTLQNEQLNVPEELPLPGRDQMVPFVLVADDTFALKRYIMKPYPFRNQPAANRVFNYHLSRARRLGENTFGIMTNRFRVLRKRAWASKDNRCCLCNLRIT